MRKAGIAMALLSALLISGCCGSGCCAKMGLGGAKKTRGPQVTCPIMGAKVNKDLYVDAAGARIYVCCNDCIAKVKADPKAAIQKILANGEMPETRLVVCSMCGEIKGAAKCCVADAEKCPKCGLHKDSIGCCRHLKPAAGEKDVVLCPMCGEVKGSAKCCVADAEKCPKCGLIAGSPGCCKLAGACPCGTAGTAAACGCQ